MRIANVGLAVIVIAFGILGLILGDFMPIWAPVSKDMPAREVLVYACAAVSLAAGIGLLVPRVAGIAARVLLAQLVIWVLVFRARAIIHAPGTFGAWDGCAETVAIISGVLVLAGGVRIARVLYGVALIPFALAHFIYPDETAALVPGWLPAHTAWAYFTGGTFLLAGVAVIVGVQARLAAALSTAQMGLFTVMVWIPIVAGGARSAFVLHELGISAALTAAGWVVADSYRRQP
jgi:uncharacterized membrane protein